jgi:hypothetical protein
MTKSPLQAAFLVDIGQNGKTKPPDSARFCSISAVRKVVPVMGIWVLERLLRVFGEKRFSESLFSKTPEKAF